MSANQVGLVASLEDALWASVLDLLEAGVNLAFAISY
jgi:hypothetical protein